MLELVPIHLTEANKFVRLHHRHHSPTVGHKFSVGAALDGELVGVAIAGRPVGRRQDDGKTIEVTRVCTLGHKNVPSMLYGAISRAAFALGYKRVITYTLCTESGTSLRASGWTCTGKVNGRSWSVPSRQRIDKSPVQLQDKFRWETYA